MIVSYAKVVSEVLSCTLYLHNRESNSLLIFQDGKEKRTKLPSFLDDMASKNQFRRLVEKDGLKSVYHRFPIDDNYTMFFQDKLDDSMVANFIKTLYETKVINDAPDVELDDSDNEESIEKFKNALINAKTEQVRLRQGIRQRESLNNQYRTKIEYLSNDLVVAQKLLRDQNDIIAMLKTRSEEYYSIIKKLNSTTERTNMNKLKDVNEQLRQELTKAHFNAKTADDTAEKLRRNSTLAFQEAGRVLKNDNITKTDIMKILNYLLINESLSRNSNITIDDSKLNGNEMDIKKTIIALNNAIRTNDISEINIGNLAEVTPINIEEAKDNPSIVIDAITTILNLVKARKLTHRQLEILTSAVNSN